MYILSTQPPPTMPLVDKMAGLLLEQTSILAIVYVLMFAVVFYDRFMGITKAKSAGKQISSLHDRNGTGSKLSRYFGLLFIATAVDFVQILAIFHWEMQTTHDLPQLPFLTFAIAIWLASVEWRSIYETAEEKEKARMEKAARMWVAIAKNPDFKEAMGEFGRYINDKNNGNTQSESSQDSEEG